MTIFRELAQQDISLAEAVFQNAYETIIGIPLEVVQLLKRKAVKEYRSGKGKKFVLEDDGRVVGTINVLAPEDSQFQRPEFRNLAEIRNMAAFPGRRGYGSAMIHGAERYALGSGYSGLVLSANPEAEGFYSHTGFRTLYTAKDIFLGQEIPSPIMVKRFSTTSKAS